MKLCRHIHNAPFVNSSNRTTKLLRENPVEKLASKEKPKQRAVKEKSANPATRRVGQQLRKMRKAQRLSIRALAEVSGLSVNTLSLIEHAKTSPSVNTLHQLAQSLDVPITAFFEYEHSKRTIVYQKAGERQQLVFSQGRMEKLSGGSPLMGSEPFVTKLEPGASSGSSPIEFPGREFIYCLEGHITYTIEGETYPLAPGDSLTFEAYTPHSWRNTALTCSSALLVVCPEESLDEPPEQYLMPKL